MAKKGSFEAAIQRSLYLFTILGLYILQPGCGERDQKATQPDSADPDVTIAVVLADLALPGEPVLVYGAGEDTDLDHTVVQGDTAYVALPLPRGRPHIVCVVRSDYDEIYSAAVYPGVGPSVTIDAGSTAEVPIFLAPGLYADSPGAVESTLVRIHAHPSFLPMVARVGELLPHGNIRETFNDPEVDSLAREIILATGLPVSNRPIGAADPQSMGSVSLVPCTAEEETATGIRVEGPFGGVTIDLRSCQVTVINSHQRYMIPYRQDYWVGFPDPLPAYKFPADFLPPAPRAGESRIRGTIDFEMPRLAKTDLIICGPGGRDACESLPWTTAERQDAYARLLIPTTAGFASFLLGFSTEFWAWVANLAVTFPTLTYEWANAVHAGDRVGSDDIFRRVIVEFFRALPVRDPRWKAANVAYGCFRASTLVGILTTTSNTREGAKYTLVPSWAEEPDSGFWGFDWGELGTVGLRYRFKVGHLYPDNKLGLIFSSSSESPTSPPQAIISLSDASSLQAGLTYECAWMFVDLDNGDIGFGYAPFQMTPNEPDPPIRSYVTFSKLEMPEGLFPGLASGSVTGELGVLVRTVPDDPQTWRWFRVRILDASFEEVRVYIEPTAGSGTR